MAAIIRQVVDGKLAPGGGEGLSRHRKYQKITPTRALADDSEITEARRSPASLAIRSRMAFN